MLHGHKIERIAGSLLAKLPQKIGKTVSSGSRTAAKIINYPHRTQSFDYDCGATAVLTVVQYYGFDCYKINEQGVFDAIGTDQNGTDNEGIETGLVKMGFQYASVRTLADIDKHVGDGHPVIVSVAQWIEENGDPIWHYEVVISNEGDRYIISDPWALTLVWVKKDIFERLWFEPDEVKTQRWGVAVIGEPKFKGGVELMEYRLPAHEHHISAHLLEQITPDGLPKIWYETEEGQKFLPQQDQAFPGILNGHVYQHSRIPNILHHEVLRVDSTGKSEKVRDSEQPWREELVVALVRHGYALSEAILVAATACMRCRCVLAYELGLDSGYAYGSAEYEETDTECELCRSKE